MISKIWLIFVLCVTYAMSEAPVNRYRFQRLRQGPQSRSFARQEAPYPESSGGEPAAAYGPPSTPKPAYGPPPPSQYGAPSNGDSELGNESPSNTDTEAIAGQPSRFTEFEKLTLPTKKPPQKFSQRLELQQQVQQFPAQPQFLTAVPPVQPVFASPLQVAAPIQQEGSYLIQLSNGVIQRVNYLTQPSLVDDSVLAKLQFQPVAEVQTTVAEPQLYVNTLVQSHVTADE